jgi:hypothetical protein
MTFFPSWKKVPFLLWKGNFVGRNCNTTFLERSLHISSLSFLWGAYYLMANPKKKLLKEVTSSLVWKEFIYFSLSLSLSLSYTRTCVGSEKPYVSFLSIGNNNISPIILRLPWHLLGFAYQGQDIVFRFIIEYSSLRDFYRPLGNNNRSICIWGFLKDGIFWLVLKLEISYRVMISWRILISCRGFFWRLYFCMMK